MSMPDLLISAAIFGAVLYAGVRLLRGPRPLHPLPPGPKPKPFVGNMADMPPVGALEWEHWEKHNKLYGPISSITAMGTTIVILHTLQGAIDLLDRRSAIYSDRPRQVFGGEMCGWDRTLGLIPYGSGMRAARKFMHGAMGRTAIGRYAKLQEREVHRFLLRTLERPQALRENIRKTAGAIILQIAYGYSVEPHGKDPLVQLADKAVSQFTKSVAPGAWLVDLVPSIRHLPDWLPGMSFKRTARAWRATLGTVVEKPQDFVRRQMAAGVHAPSILSQAYENSPDMDDDEREVVTWATSSLYTGGSDTTVSSGATFFLAMSLYPEVQRRAQAEIDGLLGDAPDRLPTLADRERLPYVGALVNEVHRFHPIAPMGLPHRTTAEDVYQGYRIPKGALVMACPWLYSRDESVYPDPERFDPERFLGPDPAPYPSFAFGFGRRVCPGQLLAEQSVWLMVARSLAVFDVSSSAAGEGKKQGNSSSMFLCGVISQPAPFEATVRPRTPAHAALIRDVERTDPWQESHAREIDGLDI